MKPVAVIFESGSDRYQPDPKFTYNDHPDYKTNQRRLAAIVGLAAMGLPTIMLVGALVFGTCFYVSISHFYYAQFLGGVFIAILVFIATFLVTYRGESRKESNLATFAGIGALGVALFPTSDRGCDMLEFSGRALVDFSRGENELFVTVPVATIDYSYFELFPSADTLHFICASVVFLFLAYYSFRVFTRVIDAGPDDKVSDVDLPMQKRKRNAIYQTTGWIIVISMAIMFANFFYGMFFGEPDWWNGYRMTFWLEAISLWAFGFSWMVKGRFFDMATMLMDERDFRSAV